MLVEDPAWAWLRPLSALIVQLDALEDAGAGQPGDAWLAEARHLIRPDSAGTPFQQHYAFLIERSPEVAYAHGALMPLLRKNLS